MGNSFKVVISDHRFPDIAIQEKVLSKIGAQLVVGQTKNEDELIALARDADAILCARANVTKRVIKSLDRCKVIVRYGVGVDTIALDAATEKGILVCNVLDYCVDEVADHAFALLLCLARKIMLSARKVRDGKWNIADLKPIKRLQGQVVGVAGFGRIGRAFARKAASVGFKILAYDPYLQEKGPEDGVVFTSFERLLKESDYLSLHLPLTEETAGMIGEKQIEMMKSSAFIVNVSRGGLIDENALADALEKGRIAGAGLDVLTLEPPKPGNHFIDMDQVVVTSHVAFYSDEAIEELQRKAAEIVVTVLSGGIPDSVVNAQALSIYSGDTRGS